MIASHHLPSHFFFRLLFLAPSTNRFSFIYCGAATLIHLPLAVKTPRFLANQNPPLGQSPNHGFYETTENWTEGDLLISHSFDAALSTEKQGQALEDALQGIVKKTLSLSAQSQAEGILSGMTKTFPALAEAHNKTVLTIHRII